MSETPPEEPTPVPALEPAPEPAPVVNSGTCARCDEPKVTIEEAAALVRAIVGGTKALQSGVGATAATEALEAAQPTAERLLLQARA